MCIPPIYLHTASPREARYTVSNKYSPTSYGYTVLRFIFHILKNGPVVVYLLCYFYCSKDFSKKKIYVPEIFLSRRYFDYEFVHAHRLRLSHKSIHNLAMFIRVIDRRGAFKLHVTQ